MNHQGSGYSLSKLLLILTIVLASSCRPVDRLAPLRVDLLRYADSIDAEVGVAVLTDAGDSLTIHNEIHYPLMSVFKFHQSLAVASYLAEHQIPLTHQVYIPYEAMQIDTYSPMRTRYPLGDISLTVGELLEYTLQWSDNLACDILFSHFYNAIQTDSLLRAKTGISDFCIRYNELQMQRDFQLGYANWSSPYAMVELIDAFLNGDIVTEPYATFIKHTMTNCQTGESRLALPILKNGGVIGHKTGSGNVTPNGELMAVNDVGYVLLPNGQGYAVAVFLKNAKFTLEDAEGVIANISAMIYDYLI